MYIKKEAMKKLARRAYYAKSKGNREVCGLIVDDGKSLDLEFCENIAKGGGKWQISVDEQNEKMIKNVNKGKEIVGTFHSHPLSEAKPGDADIKNNHGLMLIRDVIGCETKLWKITGKNNKKLTEIKLLNKLPKEMDKVKVTWASNHDTAQIYSSGIELALCSDDNRQIGTFVLCKDFFQDAILAYLYNRTCGIYGYSYNPKTMPPVPQKNLKVFIANSKDAELGKKIPNTIDFLNQIEEKMGIQNTIAKECENPPKSI